MTNLKKANVKKVSTRAQEYQEKKAQEEAAEEAKKQAALAKQKRYNKNALDLMASIYGFICAVFAFLFNKIGIFSLITIILGFIAVKRTKDTKDKFYYLAIFDLVVGLVTGVLFILYLMGIVH